MLVLVVAACAGDPGPARPRALESSGPTSDQASDPGDTDAAGASRARSQLAHVTLWPENRAPVQVSAEVVHTPEGIERGLMYRRHLVPDHGMLFYMGYEDRHPFWMKNTYIALDLIFIARDRRVVGVIADARPFDETSLVVATPSLYVLEVGAGFAARHGIGVGTRVEFENLPPAIPTADR